MCTFIGCTFICMMVLKVMASMGQSSDEPFKKPPPVPWPKGKPPPPFKKAPPLPWPNYPNGKPPPPLIDEHREKAPPVLPKRYVMFLQLRRPPPPKPPPAVAYAAAAAACGSLCSRCSSCRLRRAGRCRQCRRGCHLRRAGFFCEGASF
jgi:hypothetical protein